MKSFSSKNTRKYRKSAQVPSVFLKNYVFSIFSLKVLRNDESFLENPCENLDNFEETQLFSAEQQEKPQKDADFPINSGKIVNEDDFVSATAEKDQLSAKTPEEIAQNADISAEIMHLFTDLQEKSDKTA